MTTNPVDYPAELEAIARRLDHMSLRDRDGLYGPEAALDAQTCREAARQMARVRTIYRSDVPCPDCRQPLITDGRVHWCEVDHTQESRS